MAQFPFLDHVQVTRKVSAKITPVGLTAAQWELYSDMKGSAVAARALNTAFTKAVNAGKPPAEVRKLVEAKMEKYASNGACDTEPRWVLNSLMVHVFGESDAGEIW